MAYDGFFAGLSTRASVNEILNLAMKTKDEAERIAVDIKESEENARLSALEAAMQADRAQRIADGIMVEGTTNLKNVGVYPGSDYGVTGGKGFDESKNINRAIKDCGTHGGGIVVIRSVVEGEPIHIDGPVQIEESNTTLLFQSPITYGPNGTMRVSGSFMEIKRTELGQKDMVALASDSTKDDVGRMQFTVREGEGKYLEVGDRLTLRGQNDSVGNALEKQTITVFSIDGDTVVAYEDPELTFRAKYPNSEWEPDLTTGTTVAIVKYSAFVNDLVGPNVLTAEVANGSKFAVGDLVYVSDGRQERHVMAPEPATLKSAAVMEHVRIVKVEGNVLTFDKPLARQYDKAWKGGVSVMNAVTNSHIIVGDLTWDGPQSSRKNSCLGINFGDKCTVKVASMRGRHGRIGTAIRIAYSYDCTAHGSQIFDALRHESAEGYGIVMYYSTFCRITGCLVTGSRHSYLIQTSVSCDIVKNISTDDYISGVDLHGAGAINCRIIGNRITRSKNYSPDANKGGGIRNGNTSHMIGDHGTLIADNYIEGYNDGPESAAMDLSPSSKGCIFRDNTIVDCSIGFRHYRVADRATVTQVADRVILMGNTFTRVKRPLDTSRHAKSLIQELVLIDNMSIDNSEHFVVMDVPKVTAINNKVISPINTAGSFAFDFKRITDLYATGNIAKDANCGVRIEDCPGAKIVKNLLDYTRDDLPFRANGVNTGFVEKGNTVSSMDDGGGASIQVGTVTTGAPGTDAIVTNVGTLQDAIFDFTIPRGDPGQDGGGGGGGQNSQAFDDLPGAPNSLAMFLSKGNLQAIPTGAAGRAILSKETEAAVKEYLNLQFVNNTPDAQKPLSDAAVTALAAKAPKAGAVFEGSTTRQTHPASADDSREIATTGWVRARLGELPTPDGGASNPYKTFALWGDSLSGNNSKDGMNYNRGFLTWANVLSGQRVFHNGALNFGRGGENSTQIAARAHEVIAAKPDIVLLELGGNDFSDNIHPDTTIINTKTALDAMEAAGIKTIVCTIYPTFGTQNELHWAACAKINAWIVEHQYKYRHVEVLDAYSIMWDYVGDTHTKTDHTMDTTHTGTYGAYYLGKALGDIIKRLVPVERGLPSYNTSDKVDVVQFQDGNIITNCRFSGTGGISQGTISGSVPDGWVAEVSPGLALDISTGVSEFGAPTVKLKVTGVASSQDAGSYYEQTPRVFFHQSLRDGSNWKDSPLGKLIRGNMMTCSAHVKATKVTGLGSAGLLMFYHDTQSYKDKPLIGDMLTSPDQKAPLMGKTWKSMTTPEPYSGLLYAAPFPVGKPAGLRIGVILDFPPGAPTVDAEVEFCGITFRRLPRGF